MPNPPIEPPAVDRAARVVQLGDRRTAIPADRVLADFGQLLADARSRILAEQIATPWQSVRRLGGAWRTFGRELRIWAGAWLRAHRIGFVERAHNAGYVAGYRQGLEGSPGRSA